MKKKLYIAFVFIAFAIAAKAQRPVFTLNQYTPLLISPASPTLNYRAELSFLRNEVTVADGEYLNTNSFNADYVFVEKSSGRKWLGLGLNALSVDLGSSDLLKSYELGLSVATPIQLTDEQSLHFGMNVTYVNTRTSMDQLTTGSQWIAAEFRYDPNAALGENFEISQLDFISISSGLIWNYEREGRNLATFGVSVWDLNKPNMSFFDEEARSPMTFQIFGESAIYQKGMLTLTPSFYYQRMGEIHSYNALLSTQLFFHNDNPYDLISSGSIDLIMGYGFNQDASIAVVFNQPNVSVGFAYNFPLGQKNQYIQSGLQLGLTVSKALWKPKPKRILIESISRTRKFDFEEQRAVVYQETEVEQIKNELEELDEVKSLQFELNKDFHFTFGKAELDDGSYPFLDDVVMLLKEHPNWTLQIIGHTDNVGSKQDNYDLSIDRAQIVADYLMEKGVKQQQISIAGRGDTEPIADNETEEGKSENRRVQFIIHAVNE